MNSENFNNRIEAVRKKYTKKHLPTDPPNVLLKDSIATSFYEINHSLNQLTTFSISLFKNLNKKDSARVQLEKTEASKQQLQAHQTDNINTTYKAKPISLFDKIDLKKLGSLERLDGSLIDIQTLFNQVPIPVSAVIEIDCSLKEESVCFIPFERRDKYEQLRQLSLKQEDNTMKSLFQYKVHNLSFRQIADIIGIDLFQSNNEEPHQKIQFIEDSVIHIRSNKQYQLILKEFRNFQKFFFQGKRSIGTQLKLGELLTEQQISFDNLMETIETVCQLMQKSQAHKGGQLKDIYKVVCEQAQSKLEQMVTFLASDYNMEKQFHEIYVVVFKFKKLLLSNQFTSFEELLDYTRLHSSFDWFSHLKQYLFGLPIKTVFNLILRCAGLLRLKRSQTSKSNRKQTLRSYILKA